MDYNKRLLAVIVVILFIILTFMSFRPFLMGDEGLSGYTGEIAAAFFGGILTIIITALLLHKQTEVELNKERNVRVLDEKIAAYNELIIVTEKVLEESVMKRSDKLRLQLINQKLIQIASNDVINGFQKFSKAIQEACRNDDEIDDAEMEIVLKGLQEVSLEIRVDIASLEERGKIISSIDHVKKISENVIKAFKLENTREISERCTDLENEYFAKLREVIDDSSELSYHSGKVGFSIKKNGIPVLWCYPITPSTKHNLIFHRDNMDNDSLKFLQVKNVDMGKKRIPLNLSDVSIDELVNFLSHVNTRAV